MKRQELHALPEKFSLNFSAHCGTGYALLTNTSYAQCRDKMAEILKKKRQSKKAEWNLSVLEPGMEWEAQDDNDAGYFSGIYHVNAPEIKGRCARCGTHICVGDKHFFPIEKDDSWICCSEFCAETHQAQNYNCDQCGEPVGEKPWYNMDKYGTYCSEGCHEKALESHSEEE